MVVERDSFGSVSLVSQGEHRFYTLTLPSEVLAKTCFVVSREENPIEGFQRSLDEKRATEIASYIDNGGTIPSAIVLSAQEASDLNYTRKSKTLAFNLDERAFMILDGQHRVFGFAKSKTSIRVPVVIYNNLSRKEESRLFIDINSKQKGVPPELLLDIKNLAEYESDEEEQLRDIFDLFHSESDSALLGKLSPAKTSKGKLTRTVVNKGVKPLLPLLGQKRPHESYEILNAYYIAFADSILGPQGVGHLMTKATVFRAISAFFPSAASRVKDRFGSIYSIDHFEEILSPLGSKVRKAVLTSSGQAYKPIVKHLEELLAADFQL